MMTAEELYYCTGVDLLGFDDELTHYGVLGMKWGHRKDRLRNVKNRFRAHREEKKKWKHYRSKLIEARNKGYHSTADMKVGDIDPHGGPNGKPRYAIVTPNHILDKKRFMENLRPNQRATLKSLWMPVPKNYDKMSFSERQDRYMLPMIKYHKYLDDLMSTDINRRDRGRKPTSTMSLKEFTKKTGVDISRELEEDKKYYNKRYSMGIPFPTGDSNNLGY